MKKIIKNNKEIIILMLAYLAMVGLLLWWGMNVSL